MGTGAIIGITVAASIAVLALGSYLIYYLILK